MKTRLALLLAVAVSFAVQAGEPDPGYVAHEWGTFTSVQGADGVQLDWNPLVLWDLPKFVYDASRLSGGPRITIASKAGLQCRQRMETPVIYFYSDRERTVDAAVTFPQGDVTEWYPQRTAADLSVRLKGDRTKRPAINWKDVQILPPASEAGREAAEQLPRDSSGSHYFAARETDAAFVRTLAAGGKTEVEKFLFYRGVGYFEAPLIVTLEGPEKTAVRLANRGVEPLPALFLYEVRGKQARMISAGDLAVSADRVLTPPANDAFAPLETTRTALAEKMTAALVQAGLYPREAAAMVQTWDTAWFGEQGMRVLYLLPRAWTERTLPLALSPAPRETARVMVGRAEIITPQMERALASQVESYIKTPATERLAVVASTREMGLGRFMEATMRRVMTSTPRSQEFSSLSWELLQAASRPEGKPTAAAKVQ